MNYGIDIAQLRIDIVRPALRGVDLWSAPAENLVLGTALVESLARFVRQVGGGPAVGLWQMEPATHNDIWTNYIAFDAKLSKMLPRASAERMVYDLRYAAQMCRVHYRRVKAPLPLTSLAAAEYWKRYYNTVLGAGTVEKALPHFEVAYANP